MKGFNAGFFAAQQVPKRIACKLRFVSQCIGGGLRRLVDIAPVMSSSIRIAWFWSQKKATPMNIG